MRRLANLACAAFAAGALFANYAVAQQASVTGPELLSGTADKRLQDVARDAKSDGKKLVISAPEYWHEMILEQVRKGGGGDVQVELRDSFAETVSVRAEATAPAAAPEPTPVPEPAPVAAPAPAPTPPPVVPRVIPRQTPAATARQPSPRPVATPAPAPKPSPPRVPAPATVQAPPAAPAVPTPAPEPAATPAAEPAPTAATPGPAATPAETPAGPAPNAAPPSAVSATSDAEIASIKRRLEQNLNGGDTVDAGLRQTDLEAGDVIYVEGPVRAVLRRESLRNELYWLEGDLNLMRVELKELAGDRYQVTQRIRTDGAPRLRAARATQTALFAAADPEGAPERQQLERRYNGGKPITRTLRPDGLRQKDVLYLGDKLVVVVRLAGLSLERYWLVGDINLGRTELIRDGANKYKVLADIR